MLGAERMKYIGWISGAIAFSLAGGCTPSERETPVQPEIPVVSFTVPQQEPSLGKVFSIPECKAVKLRWTLAEEFAERPDLLQVSPGGLQISLPPDTTEIILDELTLRRDIPDVPLPSFDGFKKGHTYKIQLGKEIVQHRTRFGSMMLVQAKIALVVE